MPRNSTPKTAKTIDLGALQDAYEKSRKELAKAAELQVRHIEGFNQAKHSFEQAEISLKEGTKAVLG